MLYIDEIFLSIQGEASETGYPCIFIRTFGCPIGCVYCDQPQDAQNKKRRSIGTVIDAITKFKGVKRVCITGGEPLIYSDIYPIIYELNDMGYKVSVETSGCVPIELSTYRRTFKYVMDIKTPSSKVAHKNIYDNLLHLQKNDEVKFVVADREDYDFMKNTLRKYPTMASILVSPMFDKDNKAVIGKDLVKWILEDGLDVRVQLQLHKILDVQ